MVFTLDAGKDARCGLIPTVFIEGGQPKGRLVRSIPSDLAVRQLGWAPAHGVVHRLHHATDIDSQVGFVALEGRTLVPAFESNTDPRDDLIDRHRTVAVAITNTGDRV